MACTGNLVVVFDPREAFFLRGGDNAAVDDHCGGGIVIEGGNAQNRGHFFQSSFAAGRRELVTGRLSACHALSGCATLRRLLQAQAANFLVSNNLWLVGCSYHYDRSRHGSGKTPRFLRIDRPRSAGHFAVLRTRNFRFLHSRRTTFADSIRRKSLWMNDIRYHVRQVSRAAAFAERHWHQNWGLALDLRSAIVLDNQT